MSKLNNCTAQAINNILRIVDNKVKREITNIEGNQAIEHINQKLQQQIKDLILELIDQSKQPVPDGTYYQFDLNVLRQKVNAL